MNKKIIMLACTILVFGMFVQSEAASNATNTTATAHVSETIDVSLSYPEDPTGINFGDLSPDTYNNRANTTLNITIEYTTNVRTNISMKASDDFRIGASSDIIDITQLIYNNMSIFEHTYDNNVTMSTDYPATSAFPDWMNISRPTGGVSQHRNSTFYLSVPESTVAGTYQTVININVTRCNI